MTNYLKTYKQEIRELLKSAKNKNEAKMILQNHRARVSYFQHERLIHLLVTLFFAAMFVCLTGMVLVWQSTLLAVLDLLVLVLLVPYIFHYFKLENGVQSLYRLDDLIEAKVSQLK